MFQFGPGLLTMLTPQLGRKSGWVGRIGTCLGRAGSKTAKLALKLRPGQHHSPLALHALQPNVHANAGDNPGRSAAWMLFSHLNNIIHVDRQHRARCHSQNSSPNLAAGCVSSVR